MCAGNFGWAQVRQSLQLPERVCPSQKPVLCIVCASVSFLITKILLQKCGTVSFVPAGVFQYAAGGKFLTTETISDFIFPQKIWVDINSIHKLLYYLVNK